MEGAECLPVGPVTSECPGWSDLSQKAAAYASERLMMRAAEDMEAKMRAKMESLQKQLDAYRIKDGALERSHEELKTLHAACKADLEHRVAQQKTLYEERISRLKEQVSELEKAAVRGTDLEKLTHEQNVAAESLRLQNAALREELDRMVETQNDKQAQSSKEKAALREEVGRLQARVLDLETKNQQLTRQLEISKKESSRATLERENISKTLTAEMDQIRQHAQDATVKAQESERKASEEADSLRLQLQRLQEDYEVKLQRMQEILTRQTQQLSSAEENLTQQKRELEERLLKLKQDTNKQIATQDEEKRRALAETLQELEALKQEGKRKSAKLQELQDQCERLAYERATAQAKCEELSRRAEGVKADCERRVGEFDRLQADFRELEESHRNLLAEMETLTTVKEDAAAKLTSFKKQLDLRQQEATELKEANQDLQVRIHQVETARELLLRRLHQHISGSQRMKHLIRQKLDGAKKTEDELNASVAVLRNRLSEVTAERNGLWQVVLKLKSGPAQGDTTAFESTAHPSVSTFASGRGFPTNKSSNALDCLSNNSITAAYNSQSTFLKSSCASAGPAVPMCPGDATSDLYLKVPHGVGGTQAAPKDYANGGAVGAGKGLNELWDAGKDDIPTLVNKSAPPYVDACPSRITMSN